MSRFFSKVTMTPEGLEHKVRTMAHHSYDLHKEMWGLFPGEPEANRSFLYTVMDDGRTILMVSEREPVYNSFWNVESKVYEPVVTKCDRYRFRLCANPTVARTVDGKHQRHDVVMDMKRKLHEEGVEMSQAEIVDRAVSQWLDRKAKANGFIIEPGKLLVHSYERNETHKSSGKTITFSTAVMEGILTVTDTELFCNALYNGIGSAKGFGCGMLTIKRL